MPRSSQREQWRNLDENCPYRQWRVIAQTAIVMPVSDGASNESIERRFVPAPLECVECHALSDTTAWRWRSYRIDDPSEDEEPALAFYCPVCAEREFGSLDHGSEHGDYYLF